MLKILEFCTHSAFQCF